MVCEKPLFYREYGNGSITVYPSIILIHYVIEYDSERTIAFRYDWFTTTNDGIEAEGPAGSLRVYTGSGRIKYVRRMAHGEVSTYG